MNILEPELYSARCIKKIEKPVLTKDDIPYEASLIFNAGVAKYKGKYVMVFRNDYGPTEETYPAVKFRTSLGFAESADGISWTVRDTTIFDNKHLLPEDELQRLYDPRITILEGKPYLCMAMDTRHGVRGCIAEIDDNFKKINIISASAPDNRNMVLFPEKIDGKYVRLERPFPVYSRGRDRFDLWLSTSPDLKFWGETELVLAVEDVPYANDKIGPAAPPVKTDKGWLTLFHAVDKDEARGKNGWEGAWKKRYCAGIMLLDLDDPTKVIGMSKLPLIAPETYFETEEGFRQQVIFPGGMILEDSGEVKIYYGASDTVECLATANIDDLIALCTEKRK
ncbi:MAG: glycoside hydrolase family 130 protein [Clostridia bacterium]|nr:glycoside hydrolase family 130 protein [Clostridia bacterium]